MPIIDNTSLDCFAPGGGGSFGAQVSSYRLTSQRSLGAANDDGQRDSAADDDGDDDDDDDGTTKSQDLY